MRPIVSVFALTLALAGCAAQVLSTTPRSVVVQAQHGVAEGQPIAEAECQKQNLHARFNTHAGAITRLVFDCVQ